MHLDEYSRSYNKLKLRLSVRGKQVEGTPVEVFANENQKMDFCAIAYQLTKLSILSYFLLEVDAKKHIWLLGRPIYQEIGNIYMSSSGSTSVSYKKPYGNFIIKCDSSNDTVQDFAKTIWKSKTKMIAGFEYFDQYSEYAQILLGNKFPKKPC